MKHVEQDGTGNEGKLILVSESAVCKGRIWIYMGKRLRQSLPYYIAGRGR